MAEGTQMRKLFLSHVPFIVVGADTYTHDKDPRYNSLKNAIGYVYVDRKSENLCVKDEATYVELNPELGKWWADQLKEKKT